VLVHVEYISRRPQVSLAHFHAIAGEAQGGWAGANADDRLILNLGRTWRVGPEPEYLAVWFSPAAGLERLGGWEQAFSSGMADRFEKPMELAARIDEARCYEPLLTSEPRLHVFASSRFLPTEHPEAWSCHRRGTAVDHERGAGNE
jgi:hypothetical protein